QDGRIVVSGSYDGGNGNWTAGRYNSDGSLDTSFGNNGISTPYGSGNYVDITGLLLQTDKKIVTTGGIGRNVEVVVRQNIDGSLDQSFGNGGIVTAPVAGAPFVNVNSSALQSDGKIVVYGDLSYG